MESQQQSQMITKDQNALFNPIQNDPFQNQRNIETNKMQKIFVDDKQQDLIQNILSDQQIPIKQDKKSLLSQKNFKDLLAQRPPNIQQSSNQKSTLPPVQNHIPPQTSKTSANFYVTKKKSINSKSSQKLIPSKNTQPLQIKSKQENFLHFNKLSQSISDITVLILLHKVVQRMRQRGDDMTLECLNNQEKLIFISIAFLQKKIVKKEELEHYFSLQKEIISFVQKINKVTMQNFKEQDQNIDIKIFSKAVDLLMTPNLNRFVKDIKTLGKIKVLTFNNLACIYKKKKKFGIALRSVSFALQIQQALLNQQSNQQKYDIIPTYLNKAAILSEMNKHEKAIQQIMKSQKFIQKIQREVIKQISQAESNSNTQLKKRLQEKRYYGLYMKMIINYNMGAEKQHMKMVDTACEYYKQGRQLALMIKNDFMVKKFETILNKISDTKRK